MAQVAPHLRDPGDASGPRRQRPDPYPPLARDIPLQPRRGPGFDALLTAPPPVADGLARRPRRTLPARGRHASPLGQNFGRVVAWTVLGSLAPGSGLLAAGRRTWGMVAVSLASLLVSLLVTFALVGNPLTLLRVMVSDPNRFLLLVVGLGVLALAWAALVIGTHAATRRHADLRTGQRVASILLVTALIGVIGIPTAKVASYSLIMRDTLTGIFGSNTATAGTGPSQGADPWANTARMNVLLIGSDAGADRVGIRPDTLILASINTQTGDTVLFSLPRNLEKVPFPPGTPQAAAWPNGYDCVDGAGVPQCLLNAFWTFGEEHWKQYYPEEPDAFHAGLRATSEAVEQVTGLPVDQYAMVNLRGFMQFVDAIGGVTVNVRQRLPIGGNSSNRRASDWIDPGVQHLDGYHALWYARSRWSTDDYDRMRRQRCVIGAVVKAADPAKVAMAFPQIAAAAKDNMTTGIPLADLGAWVELTQRVKGAQVRSLPFTSNVIDPADPDIALMRSLVAEALQPPADTPAASPEPSSAASPSAGSSPAATAPGASASPSTDPAQARRAQDVATVC